ncbi:MAG: VWA domain-containing protein [Candidatus Levybacteria bacterium]|nr:VWA domain-containing protein [Candidatus Levybacteria bacterium]
MLEHREVSGYAPKVKTVFTQEQDRVFSISRTGTQWRLSVNKTYFESKGFFPDEIDGAVYLEEERLGKQIGASSRSIVAGIRKWQEIGENNPKTAAFKAVFERLAALDSLEQTDAQRASLARKYLERVAAQSPGSGYADQLYISLLANGLGQNVSPEAKVVETVLNNLRKKEKIEGRGVSPLDALISSDLSFASKTSWFEARFLPRLEFLERQEKRRVEKVEEPTTSPESEQTDQQESQPPVPSATQDEYEQHRGREEKGKGAPIFIIDPSFNGYWEEDSYDSIDEQTGRLVKSSTQRIRTALVTPQSSIESSKRVISGNSGVELFNLPLAPGFQLTQKGLADLINQGIEAFSDAEGHVYLKPSSNVKIAAEIAMSALPVRLGINSKDNTISEQQLPDEVVSELLRIRSLSTDSLGKIQQWKDFIGNFFKYPGDDKVVSMYAAVDNSSSRLATMSQVKLLDCYLAREFFLAGLKRLDLQDVEWRTVNGHFIASSQKDGTAHISSGTGHAWVKIRVPGERNWIIIDPTPPGDPIHRGEGAIDESQESTPQTLSKEDLDELEKEADEAEKKQPGETQDQYLLEFARDAGITTERAQQILPTLLKVDQLRDSQGRNILARLKEQFDRIIEKYTIIRQENLGLVEMSRGQTLEEPVSALIDIRSGSFDPTGFQRKKFVEETQQYYGGWDLEVVTDGSDSMNEHLGGKVKYMAQRDMSYLLHRALHRFSQEAQRRKFRLITPLKIRSSQYMFRSQEVNGRMEGKIEEIKTLSDEFTPPQMALLWEKSADNIGGGTPAHLGLKAVLERITPEEEELLRNKKLLKVVALISDGGYDDPIRVQNLIKQLQELNVIVAEFHITDAQSLEQLPQNVAERVIEAVRTLMPERVQKV